MPAALPAKPTRRNPGGLLRAGILGLVIASANGQEATRQATDSTWLRVAFAPAAESDPPAFRWLRHDALPRLAEWPDGRSPAEAFTLHCLPRSVRIDDPLPLPAEVVAAGAAQLPGGTRIEFSCDSNGREQWRIAPGAPAHDVMSVITALHLAIDGAPRTIELNTWIGHLGGPAIHGDPMADLLTIGASECGELTIAARSSGRDIRVIGRSLGGLTLPAVLAWLCIQRESAWLPATAVDMWCLRAFGSRDGDRAEAARQLQRAGRAGLPGLRALLHAGESDRLAAIASLMRLRAVAELPRIVASTDADLPLVDAMATAALNEMWPEASPRTRRATRAALRRNPDLEVELPSEAPAPSGRFRFVGMLSVVATGLLGLWLRERRRRFG